jgi:hypothetical protein
VTRDAVRFDGYDRALLAARRALKVPASKPAASPGFVWNSLLGRGLTLLLFSAQLESFFITDATTFRLQKTLTLS